MRKIVRQIVLMAIVALTSCRNDFQCSLTTTVNEDGSLTREYTVHLDSAGLTGKKYATPDSMLQFDKSWQLSWSIKGDSTRHRLPMDMAAYIKLKNKYGKNVCDTINVYAVKHFLTADEMARETSFKVGRFVITPTIRLEKSYRFFHTSYHYRESYPKLDISTPVPFSRYFTEKEIGYWLTGEPDLIKGLSGIEADDIIMHLKKQFSKWMAANVFELYYQSVIDNYDRAGQGSISMRQFAAMHDALMNSFIEESITDNMNLNTASWFSDKLKTDAYNSILNDYKLMANVEAQQNDMLALLMFKVDYKIRMPQGYVMSKQLKGTQLIAGDFNINPYSSYPHPWAYVITVAVLLASVAGLVFIRKRKR